MISIMSNVFYKICCQQCGHSITKPIVVRRMSSKSSVPSVMSAWQIHQYGNVEQLTLSKNVKVPIIRDPSDVLIEVHASSINPIDVRMLSGYGSNIMNTFRRLSCTLHNGSEFPLTLGRDFSGTVAAVGKDVDPNKIKIGDEVWGAVKFAYQGTQAQYVLVPSADISRKPRSLSHVEAASLPYVASTTWSAINTISCFNEKISKNKRVLILGGSGGLGTFAIQLLKIWGAHVTTTCSPDAIDKQFELGADVVIDYTKPDAVQELEQHNKITYCMEGMLSMSLSEDETNINLIFDLVFDTTGRKPENEIIKLLKPSRHATYVTVIMPLMPNTDKHGVLPGVTRSAMELACSALKAIRYGVHVRWAIFMPNAKALDTVANLVDKKQITPVIEKVFAFEDLPAAMKKVSDKHNRGKTVINYK